MNPKPFSSLNHFTVPVAIAGPPVDGVAIRAGCWTTAANRSHCFSLSGHPARTCMLSERLMLAEAETPANWPYEEPVGVCFERLLSRDAIESVSDRVLDAQCCTIARCRVP